MMLRQRPNFAPGGVLSFVFSSHFKKEGLNISCFAECKLILSSSLDVPPWTVAALVPPCPKVNKQLKSESLRFRNDLKSSSWRWVGPKVMPCGWQTITTRTLKMRNNVVDRTRNRLRVENLSGCVTKILVLQRMLKIDFPPEFPIFQMQSFPIMYNTLG